MNSLLSLIRICLLVSLSVSPLLAIGGQGSIAFTVGLPQGDFDRNVESTGFGLNGNFGIQLGNSPFYGGLEFAFLTYGTESRRVPFSLTIPDVTVEVETSNNIVQGHLLLRAQSSSGSIRPYADGLLGFNYLYTETKVKDKDEVDDEIASSVNHDDTAFSYGAGGGVMILLTKTKIDDDQNKPGARKVAILLDLRLRYLLGSKATYLKKGGVERENGQVTLNPVTSKTDLMTINVGVTFLF
jgi:hypothetical protein